MPRPLRSRNGFRSDAKARKGPKPSRVSRSDRSRSQLNALKTNSRSEVHPGRVGYFIERDISPKGDTAGVVLGVLGRDGQSAKNPAYTFAWRFRRLLQPLRISPAKVYDADGNLLRTITVDPVTGERVSTPHVV